MKGLAGKLEQLAQRVQRIGFVDRYLHDPSFANLFTLGAGSFGNSAFVVFNAVLCLINPSPWSATMIAMATFTFYNAIVAIIDATKVRKGDLRQQTLLRVSIAGTIGALLMLEMQMLGTYASLTDPQSIMIIEAVSGGVGTLLVLLMGCSLITKLRTG